jgi:hypothetical protein
MKIFWDRWYEFWHREIKLNIPLEIKQRKWKVKLNYVKKYCDIMAACST